MGHPLVTEALKKASVTWVAVGDGPARLLWCLASDGGLWLVTGPGEQAAPELTDAHEARVTQRGDHDGRIVTWPATVTRIDPASERWAEVARPLADKRLNVSGDAQALVDRWAIECAVLRLTPAGEPVEVGPTLPAGSLAEPPRDTPARRRTRAPFRLHRVRR